MAEDHRVAKAQVSTSTTNSTLHLTTRFVYTRISTAWRLFQSGWGNLTSLNHLRIKACENLVYLPAVEVMLRLTKLVTCPGLGGRSALLSGPEWHKISHIPCISVDPLPLRRCNPTYYEHSFSSGDDSEIEFGTVCWISLPE